MDSVSHTAALEFTLNWIRARHAVRHRWPFGRFSAAQDVNQHFYNILHLPFPLSKDYNATQTREIERRAKQLKRQIFNEALQQLTRDDDPELSLKAVESLPVSEYPLSCAVCLQVTRSYSCTRMLLYEVESPCGIP